MIDAAPSTPASEPADGVSAERLLETLRRVEEEALRGLSAELALAFEDHDRAGMAELMGHLDRLGRAARQTLLVGDRLRNETRRRAHEDAAARKAARAARDARRQEVTLAMVDAIDRPEHPRVRTERLYVELDRWLEAHLADPDFAEAPINDLIARIAADLGLPLQWTLTPRYGLTGPLVESLARPHRTTPPIAPRVGAPPSPRPPAEPELEPAVRGPP